jgi:transcriptional regulator with XRE-family HTH domain
MARQELARFLRDRREASEPAELQGRRRTPGLRREEVAERASMSVEYYTRLEQARGPHPSQRILDSIAAALRLPPEERTHMFRLAEVIPAAPDRAPLTVRPYIRDMIDRMNDTAALVTAATYDVVAANQLAQALFGRPDNLARRRFLHRDEVLTTGHEEFGEIAAARLRAATARYPHDGRLAALVAELRTGSAEFAEIWATNPVYAPGHRTKSMTHPELGRLRVNCDILTIPEDDQQVVFITADPGSPSARALRRLT